MLAGSQLGVRRAAPAPRPARRGRPSRWRATPCSGSITSPLPEITNELLRSATGSIASRRRRKRSVRQSLASSMAERSQVALVFLELGLEALEQREGVGGAAGEAGEDLVVVQAAHLARVALHHDVAERHLAVAAHGDGAVAADAEDGGAVGIEEGCYDALDRSDLGRLMPSGARADAQLRRCGPGAGNQGGCRSGSWRCRHGREAPERHVIVHWIQADARQMSA